MRRARPPLHSPRERPRCTTPPAWIALVAAPLLFSCSSALPGAQETADGTVADGLLSSAPAGFSDDGPPDAPTAQEATATEFGANDGARSDATSRADDATAADQAPTETDAQAGDAATGDSRAPDVEPTGDASADGAPGVDSADGGTELDAVSDVAVEVVPDARPVVPVLRQGLYVFASGDLSFAIDAQRGGRVVSFALAGENVLTGPDANATNYGSTFWTSPQSDWGWPPPPEIDDGPYAATIDGGTLVLRGSHNQALGVHVIKVFSFDAANGVASIEYTIQNDGAASRSLAPWEITRVHPGGVVFFPSGATGYSADSGPALATVQAAGATWFDGFESDAASPSSNIKYFADGTRGWLARASADTVFVKKFPLVPADAHAPGESAVEIYVSGDRAYVELENQGEYALLTPGASMRWTVRWYLVKVPFGLDASVGSAELVSFVDGLR